MFWKISRNHFTISLFIFALLKFQPICGQFKLPIVDPNQSLCPPEHKTCNDQASHFLCEQHKVPANCTNFKLITMTKGIRQQFVEGHNGIRNKVATNFKVANMNLIYWSRELEVVASRYVQQCRIAHDTCQYIGLNNLKVNTNMLFRAGHLISRWPSRIVRQWYLELGVGIETGVQFMDKHRKNKRYAVNFTQMIWPRTQFIGCAAAGMYQGTLLVCYYYPPYDWDNFDKHVTLGKACTKCPRNRPSCSRTFHSLCGLDLKMDAATMLKVDRSLYLLILVWFCLS